MKRRTEFVIVHDKKQREVATILQTLAADTSDNSIWELIRYKNGEKISKENMICIGKDASKDFVGNFPDKYCQYGIHIGYRNSRAWVYCEKFDWTAQSLSAFKEEMTALYKKAGMDLAKVNALSSSGIPEDIDKKVENNIATGVARLFKKGKIEKNDTATVAQAALWTSLITVSALCLLNPVAGAIGYGSAAAIGSGAGIGGTVVALSPMKKFFMWVQRIFSESNRIECQYRFAIVKVYLDYLKGFIGLAHDGETDAE